MGFSREDYWTGLPFPSPGDHPAPEGWEVISLLRQTFFLFVLTKKKINLLHRLEGGMRTIKVSVGKCLTGNEQMFMISARWAIV